MTNSALIVRDMNLVFPPLKTKVEMGLRAASAEGLSAYVFESLRSKYRQSELYAQGRTLPGPIITKAPPEGSWHEYGLAVDLAFDGDPTSARIEWTWNGDWAHLGQIMMSFGLEWYGLPGTVFREAPHFQLTRGLTIAEAKKLKAAGGLPMVWAEVERRSQKTPFLS